MTEYLQGNLTLEALQKQAQEAIVAGSKDLCAAKLKDKVAGWEWCSEFVK